MSGKCSVVLMYDGFQGKPVPLGLTLDERIKVLVKRQLIKEAEQALHGAECVGDDVLVASFKSNLEQLRNTLDLLIPREFEGLYLEGNNDG